MKEAANTGEPLFYMQDSRSTCGSNVIFWSTDGKGYSTDLDKLEVYSLESAQQMHTSRETDVPLLKSAVDAARILHVDHQDLPEPVHAKDLLDGSNYVVQVDKSWDGNDILFVGHDKNTFNYQGAASLSKKEALEFSDEGRFLIFIKSEVDNVTRKTLQSENINLSTMATNAGIKIHGPRCIRPTIV